MKKLLVNFFKSKHYITVLSQSKPDITEQVEAAEYIKSTEARMQAKFMGFDAKGVASWCPPSCLLTTKE